MMNFEDRHDSVGKSFANITAFSFAKATKPLTSKVKDVSEKFKEIFSYQLTLSILDLIGFDAVLLWLQDH